jgi:hypothetical protein
MPDGTPTSTTTTTTAPWYQGVAGVDEATVGHWTAKGWANKSAAEVAVEATKAWKEAERFVGAPADSLVRLPKDAKDEPGWNAVWQRLGKPKEAKEYDFAGVKFSDGTALEETFLNTMREAAWSLNLPKDAAASIVQRFTKYLEDAEVGEKAERDAKLLEQKAALKKNWGPNEAPNMFVAQRAAAALGVSPQDIAALESVIGYDRIMEMFRTIGTKIGEDKFVQSTNKAMGNAPMTRDEAVARKADLMSDQVWVKAFLAGDKAKAREIQALDIIITGIAAAA